MSLYPVALPAFRDNYIWCLEQAGKALVVDPGDAAPVLAWLQERQLELTVILLTHHHADHIGGLDTLTRHHAPAVYGPDENIAGVTQLLRGGETITPDGFGKADVLAVPGHTRAHIAFHFPGHHLLFCGDTLFSAGCGRLFEGSAAQLYRSLQGISALPDQTLICCAHEYTEANLRFAATVEPGNPEVAARIEEVRKLRADNRPSLPVPLAKERLYNPFLRCDEEGVIGRVSREAGSALLPGLAVFTEMRAWKDRF